jgi:NAD(P)-dependent dehydrogenase (short-subunit alcohol dehydrogenase family)
MGRSAEASFSHDNFCYVSGDLSSSDDRAKVVSSAIEKFGQIDALVNVAGVAPLERRDLLEMTEESYDRVMDINTKGTLFLTQAVAREMIKNVAENGVRGHICNISSLSAYTSSVSRGEYCISKAGVSMITKLFADRLAEYGIPVNEVRPGIIATDMTAKVKGKYDALIEGGLLPIARWGEPEDIAKAVFALCTGALPYVTGQSLDVDGGFHLRRL